MTQEAGSIIVKNVVSWLSGNDSEKLNRGSSYYAWVCRTLFHVCRNHQGVYLRKPGKVYLSDCFNKEWLKCKKAGEIHIYVPNSVLSSSFFFFSFLFWFLKVYFVIYCGLTQIRMYKAGEKMIVVFLLLLELM